MSALHLRPPAKINLGLFIKGKRSDGYHLLETLLYPLPQLSDELWLSPNFRPGMSLQMTGIPIEGGLDSNLCVKAYNLLKAHLGKLPGVFLRLHKHIPAGAGLGGGSADAAYTLRGLNQLFGLGLSLEELHPLAAQLGADLPFFLYDQPMLATGTGTELTPFSLDFPYRIDLRLPGIHSSTVGAYRALDYRQCDPARDLKFVLQQPVAHWREALVNDLEPPVFAQYPELAALKAQLYDEGAVYAAMSGSGSAVFGLFPA
jgi:4-diphosphocytidyl-2-C-methyl-D-erythritol kinase